MKIKTGDNVIMLSGKDKGKKGKVLKAFPSTGKVVVEGINILKKHQKARQQGKSGEVIELPSPVDASNVALIDPKSNKATRINYKVEGGKKVRVSNKSGQVI